MNSSQVIRIPCGDTGETGQPSENKEHEDKAGAPSKRRHSKLERFVFYMAAQENVRIPSYAMNAKDAEDLATLKGIKPLERPLEFEGVSQFFQQITCNSPDKPFDKEFLQRQHPLFLFSYLIVLSIQKNPTAITRIYQNLSPVGKKLIDTLCESAYNPSHSLQVPLPSDSVLINNSRISDLRSRLEEHSSSPDLQGREQLEYDEQRLTLYITLEIDNLPPSEPRDKLLIRAQGAILRLPDNAAPTRNKALEKMWWLLYTFRIHISDPKNKEKETAFKKAKKAYHQFAERMLYWTISPQGYRIAGYLMLAAATALSVLCGLSAGTAIGFGIGAASAFALSAVFFQKSKKPTPYYRAARKVHDACDALTLNSGS